MMQSTNNVAENLADNSADNLADNSGDNAATTKKQTLSRPYFIACHDAGAANIIMAEERAIGFSASYYCLKGPAFTKWASHVPAHKLCDDLHHAISQCQMLRSGTGWASDFEHRARALSLKAGLHVIAVIDHWVNYEKRFIREAKRVLPNEIEVMDEYAHGLARDTFFDIPVTVRHNHYLDMTLEKARTAPIERCRDILYVLEPVPENWGADEPIAEEFQALNYFRRFVTERFSKLPSPHLSQHFCELISVPCTQHYDQIRLRLHPSESKDKYAKWVEQNADLPVVFDDYDDIETSIANAKWVFGCESYGLVVALHCGKEVYSSIPHWAPLARLPHKGLKHLRDLMPLTI